MWGLSLECLVDTGATVNILSLTWWRAHGERDLIPTREIVYSVEGRPLHLHGRVWGEVTLGGRGWDVEFQVTDTTTDAILGSQFLRDSHFMVDLAGERILRPTGCEEDERVLRCRVITRETTVINGGEEALVDSYLVGDWGEETDGLLEGLRDVEEKRGILVGRSLVDTRSPGTLVRVFNPGHGPVTIYGSMALATVEPVASVVEDDDDGSSARLAPPPRPERLPVGDTGDPTQHCRMASGTEANREEDAVVAQLLEGAEPGTEADLEALVRSHRGAFQMRPGDMGRATMVEHHIKTGNHPPIKQAPRRLAPHRRALVDVEVDKMLESGVIEAAGGPWAAPVVLVKKKDGTMRFCVDYRRLNSITVKDAYPLPRIDDSLDTLAGSEWFSTMDLVSGYWQVAMAEGDREKTAFSTHRGLYQFTVMPFGLCNAPGTFERLMEVAMRGLQWTSCLVYLDDIVVFSRDFQSHLERLGEVLRRLESAGLKVKPSKCHLARKRVAFLGHVVSAEGVSTDPAKVEAVKGWPTPQSLTETRSFIGLAGYYRAFVPDFATIAKPLTMLADKGRVFRWSEECQTAFDTLKGLLTEAPVLGYPQEEGQIVLDTDASDRGLGAVLSQRQTGTEIVLSYGSRTLTKAERNYCVTRRELLAIIFGLKKFRHYLLGRNVLIRTDHAALKWVMAFKEPEGQVARWLQVLDTYDVTIEHRPGRLHGNADGLSRIPCRQCGRCDDTPDGADASPAVRAITRRGAADPDVAAEVRGEWATDQRADIIIGRAYAWVENGTTPEKAEVAAEGYAIKSLVSQIGRLEIRDGLLGRWYLLPGCPRVFQVVVPAKRQAETWRACHGEGLAGHFGRDRTLRKVMERWYWPDFRRDVTHWTATCPRCLERKPAPHPTRAKMGHIGVGLPMERMALDVMGPLPCTPRQNKYILVVMDYFTKWGEAVALEDQKAETVARALVETVVCRFGCPATLHSDQGRNFQSALFREVVRILGIDQTRTCAFRPQSDGMVERSNRTIEALLSAVVEENQLDWDEQLPLVMGAYRSSVHSTTGQTPNAMMLGRETCPPLALIYPQEGEQPAEGGEGYVARLQTNMAAAHAYAREQIGTAVVRQTRNHDAGATHKPIPLGATVYYHHQRRQKGKSPKLQRLWTGPWMIEEQIGEAVYLLRAERKRRIAHFNHIKVVPVAPEGVPPIPPQVRTVYRPTVLPATGPANCPAMVCPATPVRPANVPACPAMRDVTDLTAAAFSSTENSDNSNMARESKKKVAKAKRASKKGSKTTRKPEEGGGGGRSSPAKRKANECQDDQLPQGARREVPRKAEERTEEPPRKLPRNSATPRNSAILDLVDRTTVPANDAHNAAKASKTGTAAGKRSRGSKGRDSERGEREKTFTIPKLLQSTVRAVGDNRESPRKHSPSPRNLPRKSTSPRNPTSATATKAPLRPCALTRTGAVSPEIPGKAAEDQTAVGCQSASETEMSDQRHECPLCEKTFSRPSHRNRHVETAHSANRVGWLCPVGTCMPVYNSTRKGDIVRHLKGRQHRDQNGPEHPWAQSLENFGPSHPIPPAARVRRDSSGSTSPGRKSRSTTRRKRVRESSSSSSSSSSAGSPSPTPRGRPSRRAPKEASAASSQASVSDEDAPADTYESSGDEYVPPPLTKTPPRRVATKGERKRRPDSLGCSPSIVLGSPATAATESEPDEVVQDTRTVLATGAVPTTISQRLAVRLGPIPPKGPSKSPVHASSPSPTKHTPSAKGRRKSPAQPPSPNPRKRTPSAKAREDWGPPPTAAYMASGQGRRMMVAYINDPDEIDRYQDKLDWAMSGGFVPSPPTSPAATPSSAPPVAPPADSPTQTAPVPTPAATSPSRTPLVAPPANPPPQSTPETQAAVRNLQKAQAEDNRVVAVRESPQCVISVEEIPPGDPRYVTPEEVGPMSPHRAASREEAWEPTPGSSTGTLGELSPEEVERLLATVGGDAPHQTQAQSLSDSETEVPLPPEWHSPLPSRRGGLLRTPPATDRSFGRTPPSAGIRGRGRFTPMTPPARPTRPPATPPTTAAAGPQSQPPPAHPSTSTGAGQPTAEPYWLPWWHLTGRAPNRLERWAAHLLPPPNMGEAFTSSGGEVRSYLRDYGTGVYDVTAYVTTRYRLVRPPPPTNQQGPAGAAPDPPPAPESEARPKDPEVSSIM